MVSRRSIRIKVMQLLYSLDRDPGVSHEEILKRYDTAVDLAFESLVFNLYLIMEITHHAVVDRDTRQAKLRPEQDDLNWNAKLFENELVQSLFRNKTLRKYFEDRSFSTRLDRDMILKLYNAFSKSPEYRKYIFSEIDDAGHREFLLFIYRDLRKNDIYEEIIDDQY